MPVVSVVIPAFNAEVSLAATVASAQGQSLTDIEILIVDDASRDGTLALARRLAAADPRVKAIAAGDNRGPAGARNLGIDHAKGDYLLLEDENGAVEAMLPSGEGASSTPLTAAQFLVGNLPDPAHPRKSYGFLKPLIRRRFLEEHALRYDEGLRFAEDFAFYLACYSTGARFYLVQQPLYRYRVRADSLTARHSTEDLRRLQQVDRLLLRDHAGAAEGAFLAALKRHKRSIDQRLYWRVVIDAVKRRAWLSALGASFKGWHVFTYVSAQLAGEAWRRAGRRLGSGRARAAET